MHLLDRYLRQVDFGSYEEFAAGYRLRIPERFNFAVDVVDEYASLCPEKRALVWCNDLGEVCTFRFGEMKEKSDRAAGFLHALGVRRGDAVMLALKGRYEFWFCMLALHKLGAVAIPATHMLRVDDLVYRIRRARVVAVVCVDDPDLAAAVDAAQAQCGDLLRTRVIVGGERPGWLSFADGVARAKPFAYAAYRDRPGNGDPMLLYFTSGTTGFPKMVRHDFTYPLAHIVTARYWQAVEDDGLHYTVADTGWAKAVWGKIYGQWLAGSAVFAYDYQRFRAAGVLARVAEHRVTSFCAPPTVFRFLVREDLSAHDLRSVHQCVTAGEALNPEVYERFRQQTGLCLREGYGQTESTVILANWPWAPPKPGSMGLPSPGYEVGLLDPEGRETPRGDQGEICIRVGRPRPPGLFTGYEGDAEREAQVSRDGWYHTGDMARQDAEGAYWFCGRADDVIKSSGYRIGPFEVENALMRHPAVVECAVTGMPDPVRGQAVKATVVLAGSFEASPDLALELQAHVRAATAPYMCPRHIDFVAALPKTISGKIRRTEIRARDGASAQ
ncbi:MAG: AMP-binding protein [Lentisphaeria bacterium]|nr:AMP-binding protein [Lentisphaeria bacterium]